MGFIVLFLVWLLFSVFLSTWSCGMAGITHVDWYSSRSVIVSFSYVGSAELWVSYMSVKLPLLEGAVVQKCSVLYCKYCVFVYGPYEFKVSRCVNIRYCKILLVLRLLKVFILWLVTLSYITCLYTTHCV